MSHEANTSARAARRSRESRAESHSLLQETVGEMAEVEERERTARSAAHEVANRISRVSGSLSFVIFNGVAFAIWIVLNSGALPGRAFDTYPFGGLTLVVSLEAIFLAIFVLISQNRQGLEADRRAKIDLQVNMIAERELTKVIELVREIHDELGMRRDHDQTLEEMTGTMRVKDLAEAVEVAETNGAPAAKAAEPEVGE